MTELELKALLMAVLMIATQVAKEFFPTTADRYRKFISLAVALVGTLISVAIFLGNNTPLVVSNEWQAVVIIAREIIVGLVLGFSAVGMYSVAHNLPVIGEVVRSTDQILVAKTSTKMAGEVAVEVPTVGIDVENVEVKVTEKKAKKVK